MCIRDRILANAIAGGPGSAACEGARHLQSRFAWDLLDRDDEAREGVR